MASPARKIEELPDTLPEDFGHWDDEESPSTQLVRLAGPLTPPSLEEILWAAAREAEPTPARKKRHIIAFTSAASMAVLVAVLILVLNHRTASSVTPNAAPKPALTVAQPPQDATLKSTLATPALPAPTQPAAAAADAQQQNSAAAQASRRESAGPSRAQSQMMNDQLSAPARIHLAAASAWQVPPPSGGLAAADMEGSSNNNAIGSVFNSVKQPGVSGEPPQVVRLSAGVAFALLIQRTPPVYPTIAKTARVSGTVVLAATVSRTGAIENLHVVSGPVIFRAAALNAVRTWRYRPYKLNNQPTEFETTIDVIFSLVN
jgi:TonB family protein